MNNKKHYYWIDLLRFFCALLVVLAHYRGNFFVEYGLLPATQKNIYTQLLFLFTRLGEEPVLVFFVLSGFLVGGKVFERILNNEIDAKSYFIDRSVRILLPLLASVLFVLLIDLITKTPIPFKDMIGSIFSLQGIITTTNYNPPLWSLSYEVWFYILLGCVMMSCRNTQKKSLFPLFIFSICLYVFIKLNTIYLLILFMGTLGYFLPRQHIKFLKKKILFLIALLLLSFILLQLTSATRSLTLPTYISINREAAMIFLALIATLLVSHLIAAPPKRKIGIAVDTISSKLSGFSYTLYLTHYPLMGLLSYWGFQKSTQVNAVSVGKYFFAVLISLVVAHLISMISEKQTSQVKSYLKKVI